MFLSPRVFVRYVGSPPFPSRDFFLRANLFHGFQGKFHGSPPNQGVGGLPHGVHICSENGNFLGEFRGIPEARFLLYPLKRRTPVQKCFLSFVRSKSWGWASGSGRGSTRKREFLSVTLFISGSRCVLLLAAFLLRELIFYVTFVMAANEVPSKNQQLWRDLPKNWLNKFNVLCMFAAYCRALASRSLEVERRRFHNATQTATQTTHARGSEETYWEGVSHGRSGFQVSITYTGPPAFIGLYDHMEFQNSWAHSFTLVLPFSLSPMLVSVLIGGGGLHRFGTDFLLCFFSGFHPPDGQTNFHTDSWYDFAVILVRSFMLRFCVQIFA